MGAPKRTVAVTKDQIDSMIRSIRGVRVMLDTDLAGIYGVSTSRFNEAVKRNRDRFPADFMFQLTAGENASLRSQFATLKTGRGRHRKYRPYVFTEYGARRSLNSTISQLPTPIFPPAA